MFYVESLFQILKKKPLKTLWTLCFSVLFLLSINFHKPLTKKVSKVINQNSFQNANFSFLIDKKQNYQSLVRKLRNLPGIAKVKIKTNKQLSKNISDILGSSQLANSYIGIKVILNRGLKNSSVKLILSYLKQIIDPSHLIIGRVHNRKIVKMSLDLDQLVWWASFFIFVLFLVNLNSLIAEVGKYSYLIEQYQSLKFVSLKVSLIFFLLSSLLSFAIIFVIIFATQQQIYSLFYASIFVIFLSTLLLNFKNSW